MKRIISSLSMLLVAISKYAYFDELSDAFCEDGLALFTYNRRGCETGDTPPLFVEVPRFKL